MTGWHAGRDTHLVVRDPTKPHWHEVIEFGRGASLTRCVQVIGDTAHYSVGLPLPLGQRCQRCFPKGQGETRHTERGSVSRRVSNR